MKKLVSIFLVLALVIFQVDTAKAFADTQSEDFKYTAFGTTATITGYTGSGEDIVIPNKIDGYTVDIIGNDAFKDCSKLTSITIPNSVSTIGNGAFKDCSKLTSITIPNSVSIIDKDAFFRCSSLSNITIPNSVSTIGEDAFFCCSSLSSITIPNSVSTIGKETFVGCSSLTNITLPNSIPSIGIDMFQDCSSLSSITIPNSVSTIGDNAFNGCSGLTSITIPNSVSTIGFGAFERCTSLTSINIPSSVSTIGGYAFYGCSILSQINVDPDNTNYSILDGVLYNKNKTTLICYPSGKCYPPGKTDLNFTIPNSVSTIDSAAFYGCSSLTGITIPNSVSSIGDSTFRGCSRLTSITIPNSVSTIGNYEFVNCFKLANITIPNSVSSIGECAFWSCSSLTSITIPNSVSSIGEGAFWGSSLTSITIPNSITSISNYAFYDCSKLTSITIPSSVTNIGEDAFDRCPSTLTIYYHNTAIGFTNPWNGFKTVSGNIVSYNGNENTSGTVPVDNNVYASGSKASILNNTSNLVKTGYVFAGWNTAADGSGTSYPADASISMNGTDITLYAQWKTQIISPTTGTFTKAAPNDLKTTITAPNKLVNPITGVYNGSDKLTGGIDEAVTSTNTGYTLTLYKSYLSKLTSNTIITVKFKDGSSLNYNVILSTASISPVTGTFIKAAPADLKADITAPDKLSNPVTGVYNGTAKLTSGTDEVIMPTTTGYTLTLYKSYLSTLTSNSVITVTFKDGSFLNYNVVLGASISPTTGTFTITAPTDLKADITAPNKLANPVTGVYNGDTKLIGGTDEAIISTTTGYNLTLYKSYLSTLTSNSVITVTFKDGSSLNYNIILSTASISPITGTFIKVAAADLKADITAPDKLSNPVTGVYNGTAKLTCGTDEAIMPTTTGYTLILYKSYLSKLTPNSVITITFKDGSSLNYNVILSTVSISPVTGTFTKAAPADLKTTITAPYKSANPVTGVYNGSTKLIAGTDEAITPTTTGYTLTLFKSYLSKLTSNSVITVKFKDGSSLNYTVNIK